MQFSLATLLLVFVVVGASLATFGPAGIIFATAVLITLAFSKSVGRAAANFFWVFAAAILMLFLLTLMLFLLTPQGSGSRESMRKERCVANLQSITDALHRYHAEHGHFPPAYIADAQGRPLHSWRVLILPYLGLQALYEQYDFDEPWDGPHNRRLLPQIPNVYCCDSDPDILPPDMSPQNTTNYVAIVGDRTAWPRSGYSCTQEMHSSGTNTVLVAEIRAKTAIRWTEPADLPLCQALNNRNPDEGAGIGSVHGYDGRQRGNWVRGAHVAFADGSIRFLPSNLPQATLRSLLMGIGQESIDMNNLGMPRLNRGDSWFDARLGARLAAAVVLIFSVVLLSLSWSRGGTNRRPSEPSVV